MFNRIQDVRWQEDREESEMRMKTKLETDCKKFSMPVYEGLGFDSKDNEKPLKFNEWLDMFNLGCISKRIP